MLPFQALMSDDEGHESAEERPIFPYNVLWPGYGNAFVTLRELLDQADKYRIFSEVAQLDRHDVRFITEADVAKTLAKHGVAATHTKSFWVIACFYLTPRQIEAFEIDPKKSRQTLSRAAHHAMQLYKHLSRLSPKVEAALYYIRPTIAEVSQTDGGPFHTLGTEVYDFAQVARAAALDLTVAEGRPRHHERDTMFRLLIELIEDAGLNDLRISNGTKTRPDPHLLGRAGALMVDVIHLVEPTWSEAWIAPRVKAVRAKLRKARPAGAKTRPT